jgi:hypothetical protein
MAEEIQASRLADSTQDGADSSPKAWNCSLCGFAQERFRFAEDLFDRVRVRRRRALICSTLRSSVKLIRFVRLLRWFRLSEQIFRVDKWSVCLG